MFTFMSPSVLIILEIVSVCVGSKRLVSKGNRSVNNNNNNNNNNN